MLHEKVCVYFSSKFCFSNTIAIFAACYVSQYHVLNTMYFSSSLKLLGSEHLVAFLYPSSCHHV